MTCAAPSARTRRLEARVFLDDAQDKLGSEGPTDEVAALREGVDAVLGELEAADEGTAMGQSARRSRR